MPERPNSFLELLSSFHEIRAKHQIGTTEQSLRKVGIKNQGECYEQKCNTNITLFDLVRSRRGLGATDPRDIIYGHMGLVRQLAETSRVTWKIGTIPRILFDIERPEYRKSVEDVFMDFAHDVINQCGPCSIFRYKETQQRPGLASWAPNWSFHPLTQPQPIEREYQASPKPIRHSWIPNSRLLLLAGEILGPEGTYEILEVSEIIPWNAPNISILLGAEQRLFANDISSFMNAFLPDNSRREWYAKVCTKILSYYAKAFGSQFFPKKKSVSAVDLVIQLGDNWVFYNNYMGDSLFHLIFTHAFQVKERCILAGRRLATLSGGRIALVSPMTQVGDVIYHIETWSSSETYGGTYVFRPLRKDGVNNLTSLMAMNSSKEHMQGISPSRHGEIGAVSEEYQHCKLLGQGQVFRKDSSRKELSNRDFGYHQLLVVH